MRDKRLKKRQSKLTVFIGMPLAFLVAIYLIIYLAGSPILSPLSAIGSLLIGDEAPMFTLDETTKDSLQNLMSSNVSNTIPASSITLPSYGEKYAHVTIPGTEVDCDIYYGDSNAIMKQGAGQYIGGKFPGFGGTVLIAAHKTTHFMDLKSVEVGDVITLQTTYGVYEYTVRDMKVVDPNDKTAYDLNATEDNLILYTCYPFNMLGFSKQRYFVYADYTSGPIVDIYG